MSVQQHKDGRWYVAGRKGYWPQEPGRTKEYFGRGASGEAAARVRDTELGGRKKKEVAGPTFYELAIEYLARKDFNPNSRTEINIMLSSIILPAIGHRRAIRLTHADMDLYVGMRRSHKTRKGTYLKDSTIRREITAIKAILNWSTKRRPPLIAFNPVATYQAPEPDDDVIIPPTSDEAEAIYQAASEHLRRAIVLSWYLGLRPGAVELLSLKWADVSIDVGIIKVRSAHKGGPRHRDVPIHPGLKPYLTEWARADRAQWKIADIGRRPVIHYHGRPIKAIQTSWAGALERAGIKRRIRPYDIRHFAITNMLSSGGDIGAVSHVVGSSPETIRRHYQHVSREMTRRTVELIPELSIDAPRADMTKAARRKRKRVKG